MYLFYVGGPKRQHNCLLTRQLYSLEVPVTHMHARSRIHMHTHIPYLYLTHRQSRFPFLFLSNPHTRLSHQENASYCQHGHTVRCGFVDSGVLAHVHICNSARAELEFERSRDIDHVRTDRTATANAYLGKSAPRSIRSHCS